MIVPAGKLLVEVLDAARLLGDLQRTVVADHGYARRVVSAILQTAQAFDDDVEGLARTDVSHDAAHAYAAYGSRREAICT